MVPTWAWVVVVPLLVVNRDPHFWRIAMVQVVRTAVVLVAPIIVWVRDVRVVIKAAQVLGRLTDTPTGSISFFLCLANFACDQSQRDSANGDNANLTNHGEFLRWDGVAA